METRSKKQIREVLESIRKSIENEDLSYGELATLCDLQGYIEPGDVQLLEAAGVPEFPEDELTDEQRETLAEVRKLGYLTDFRPNYGWITYDPSNGVTLADLVYAAETGTLGDIENFKTMQIVPTLPRSVEFTADEELNSIRILLKLGIFQDSKLEDLTTPQTQEV